MAKTRIKIKGTKRLESNLNALIALGADASETLAESAIMIEEGAKQNIRAKLNKNPTGALESAVTTKPAGDNVVEIGVFDDVYGRVHEFGAVIRPVTAKALRFEINGKVIFTQQVQIPQRAWLRPAMQAEKKRTAQKLAELLKKEIKEAVK